MKTGSATNIDLIYSTEWDDYYDDFTELSKSYNDYLESNGEFNKPYSSDEVFEMFNEDNSICYDDFKYYLDNTHNDMYIVEFNHGRWDGRYRGTSFDKRSLSKIISNLTLGEDGIKAYYDEDKVFCLDTSNHDASSYYKFYIPTELGLKYLYERSSKYDPRSLAKVLIEVEAFHKNVVLNI